MGFDGSCVESRAAITEHLQSIFADHHPAAYVCKVREIRELAAGAALLRSVVGMVPPDGSYIKAEVNAVQVLVAVHGDQGWRAAHPPDHASGVREEAETLTAELRAVLAADG